MLLFSDFPFSFQMAKCIEVGAPTLLAVVLISQASFTSLPSNLCSDRCFQLFSVSKAIMQSEDEPIAAISHYLNVSISNVSQI